MNKFRVWLCHGFGLGLSPVAPGTFGTLLGLPLAWAINTAFPGSTPAHIGLQLLCGAVLTLYAIWVCDAAEAAFGKKDPGNCVADEYLTFSLGMIGLPVFGQALNGHPHAGLVMMIVAFFTNRVSDIIKPWPAHGLQRLRGGLGVTIDDAIAALYSLIPNWAVCWFLFMRH